MAIPATLSTAQVAHLLGLSHETVRTASKTGGLTVGDGHIVPLVAMHRASWPTAPIMAALGLDGDAAEDAVRAAVDGASEWTRNRRARAAAKAVAA